MQLHVNVRTWICRLYFCQSGVAATYCWLQQPKESINKLPQILLKLLLSYCIKLICYAGFKFVTKCCFIAVCACLGSDWSGCQTQVLARRRRHWRWFEKWLRFRPKVNKGVFASSSAAALRVTSLVLCWEIVFCVVQNKRLLVSTSFVMGWSANAILFLFGISLVAGKLLFRSLSGG